MRGVNHTPANTWMGARSPPLMSSEATATQETQPMDVATVLRAFLSLVGIIDQQQRRLDELCLRLAWFDYGMNEWVPHTAACNPIPSTGEGERRSDDVTPDPVRQVAVSDPLVAADPWAMAAACRLGAPRQVDQRQQQQPTIDPWNTFFSSKRLWRNDGTWEKVVVNPALQERRSRAVTRTALEVARRSQSPSFDGSTGSRLIPSESLPTSGLPLADTQARERATTLDEFLNDDFSDVRCEAPLVAVSQEQKDRNPLYKAKLRRKIGDQVFDGVVEDIEFDSSSKELLYLISYSDGDLEHLTAEETLPHLIQQP